MIQAAPTLRPENEKPGTMSQSKSAANVRRSWDLRHFWVLVHRYSGLYMAAFLIVAGITGTLLAFYMELETAVNPHLHPPAKTGPTLDIGALLTRAEAIAPQGKPGAVYASKYEGNVEVSIEPRTDPATGKPFTLDFDQLFLDRSTGKELGRRQWGAISQGLVNLMPFIYKLHYELALGTIGIWLLGIAAVIWTLDSFVGFYLTLPPGRKKTDRSEVKTSKGFWLRWKTAWMIKGSRLTFDLHRAGGLWLWAMLFIFAWSSVYMNLTDTVYTPVMRWVFDYHVPLTDLQKREQPVERPSLNWQQARDVGAKLMDEAAATHHFTVEYEHSLSLDGEQGVYVYTVRSSLDVQDRYGQTRVLFDADTGEERMLMLPSGQYSGNTVTSWLLALHMGNVFGMPYRIFVCLFGLAVTTLSATGVIIWLRKRRSARHRTVRQARVAR